MLETDAAVKTLWVFSVEQQTMSNICHNYELTLS